MSKQINVSFEIGERVIAIVPLSFVRNPKTFTQNFRQGVISAIYIERCEECSIHRPNELAIRYAIEFDPPAKFSDQLWYNAHEIYKPT